MTMRRLMTWLFGAFLLLLREDAFALGLLDGYHLALENDPQFQAAIQEHEAGRQYRALGRAALLPRLVYSYNRGRSWSDVTQTTTRGDFKEDRDYDSYVSTLSLQQPLFDYEAFSRYRKGVAQALLSDERFRSQSQELLVRVLEAYTGALLAQDQIELARAQKRSYREQFQLNQRQFERGNGNSTRSLTRLLRTSFPIQASRNGLDCGLKSSAWSTQAVAGDPKRAKHIHQQPEHRISYRSLSVHWHITPQAATDR